MYEKNSFAQTGIKTVFFSTKNLHFISFKKWPNGNPEKAIFVQYSLLEICFYNTKKCDQVL
jgi:hypothetical protein